MGELLFETIETPYTNVRSRNVAFGYERDSWYMMFRRDVMPATQAPNYEIDVMPGDVIALLKDDWSTKVAMHMRHDRLFIFDRAPLPITLRQAIVGEPLSRIVGEDFFAAGTQAGDAVIAEATDLDDSYGSPRQACYGLPTLLLRTATPIIPRYQGGFR